VLAITAGLFPVPSISQQSQQTSTTPKRAAPQKSLALAALAAIDKYEMEVNRFPISKDHRSGSAAREAINKVSDFELRKALELLMSDIQILMLGRSKIELNRQDNKAREQYESDTAEYKRDHLALLTKLI
jgi:hypothetical protein